MIESRAASKSRRAYDYIKDRISDRTYASGNRLVLGQIASKLGISVVPVREAIRLLEAEGVVTFEMHIGAQVAQLDAADYEATMESLSVLEGFATAISRPFITSQDLAHLRALNEELGECVKHFDPMNFTRLNFEFHAALLKNCPNPQILDIVRKSWARLRCLRETTFRFAPGRAQQSMVEHSALLDLIESGAGQLTVELAVRDHRLATLNSFQAYQSTLVQ